MALENIRIQMRIIRSRVTCATGLSSAYPSLPLHMAQIVWPRGKERGAAVCVVLGVYVV